MPTSSLQRSAIEANSIAWISWFNPSDPHGYIDWSTFQQLAHDWEAACENPAISAIVIHSQGRDFSPGWNPDAWLYQDEASLEKLILDTQDFLKRLEASPKPVIAAIHGKCLGPGMELSLACHWVVTSLHSSTVFGMDERNLGLVPALGATVRLPRLVGLQTALHVLLSGRTYSSVRCLKMGLANRVVVPDQLLATAGNKANSMALGHNSPARKLALDWVQQAVERIWIGRRLILRHAAERINEITHEAFPAPQLIMDATDTGWRRGMTEGLDLALKYALHASKNPGTTSLLKLRRMALDRQQKGTTSNRSAFVRRLTVLGGGRMGKGLAKLGRKYDLHVDLIERNPFTLRNLGPWAKKRGVQIFSSEQYHPHLAAEFIIEAVDENLARKTQVLQQAESILDPHGFIATNTSTLSIQTLGESLRRPGKLVGMHFFMPPGAMPLVEIIASRYTDPTVVDQAKGLASQLGKVWIQTSDTPGFFCTRVLGAYLHEALLLLHEGADIAKVDFVLRQFGFLHGPFRFMDMAGLELIQKVMDIPVKISTQRQSDQVARGLGGMVQEGFLGRGSGKGFFIHGRQDTDKYIINQAAYEWFGGSERRRISSMRIQHRMVLALLNEAARCLEEGVIASPEDGDLGAVYGLGFPAFLGGPFQFADHLGLSKVVHMLEELEEDYGTRFNPSLLFREKIASGLLFYRK